MAMSDVAAAKALRTLKDIQISNKNKYDLTPEQAKRYREIQREAKQMGMKYALEYIEWEVSQAIDSLERPYSGIKDIWKE